MRPRRPDYTTGEGPVAYRVSVRLERALASPVARLEIGTMSHLLATPPGRLHHRRRAGDRGHPRPKRRGDRQHRRRAIAPRDQPQRLRRRVRDAGATGRSQRAAEPVRRQQHQPLQLADQRRQSRAGLVLPEHPGSQRHGRQARRRLHHRRQERGRSAGADHSRPSAGSRAWAPIGRSWPATRSPSTGRRPGTTRSGFPMPATASAPATAPRSPGTTKPMPTPPTTRRSNAAGSTTWSHAGAWRPTAG